MTGAIASLLALALATPPAAAGPSIHFDQTTHDFGTIDATAPQSFSWPYRNSGMATLEIVSMNPSCGCTASVAKPTSVPPGSAGALTVTFDPAGQSGDVRKTLTVVTNDPAHPRTILTILAKVIVRETPVVPGGHPPITGQSLLLGSCGGCHAEPAKGKSGAELWAAVCAACHGTEGAGGPGPALRSPAYLAAHDDKAIGDAIAYGTASPKMPGYASVMGGPLDEAQIGSLVRLLRSWDTPGLPAATPGK